MVQGLSHSWSIGGMQSLFWYTQDGKRNLTWEPTWYVEREFAKRLAAFAEYGADFPALGGGRQVVHFGATYKTARTHQFDFHFVDFHFGFGLSHAAPRQFVAIGYSIRVDRLWRPRQP
jgi:hypothetical protein